MKTHLTDLFPSLVLAMFPALCAGAQTATVSDSNWIGINPAGANGVINAVAVDASSDLYVGGVFTVLGSVPADRIAKWNGNAWSPIGAGMNGNVQALTVEGGELYAGGAFTRVGGTPANRIAKWDGATWSPLGSGIDTGSEVAALAASDTSLYGGGFFSKAGGKPSVNVARMALVTPTSPLRLRSSALAGGVFTAWFTTSPGATFRALRTTDLSHPLNAWLPVGSVTEVTPVLYRFTDPQAANTGQRYYSIQWPD